MTTDNLTHNVNLWLCPLYSFNCDCESVDLVEGVQIKPAPNELRTYIQGRTYYLFGLRSDPGDFNWTVFLPHPAGTSNNMFERLHRASNLLSDLIITFKLCHKGRVIAGPLISASLHNSQLSIGGMKMWTPVSEINFFQEEPQYTLRQSDVIKVNNLLQDIRCWRESGVLDITDVALRRFHSAYHGDIEDRIIDQMIAFESLFLGDVQELTYKLALRVAFLLGKRREQRETIFSNMKKAYKYRGRIVHGGGQPSRDELRGIIHKTENYLRQSIRRLLLLLSQGNSLQEIRETLLDENILKNGKLLTLRE